jgi:hypothetical protein
MFWSGNELGEHANDRSLRGAHLRIIFFTNFARSSFQSWREFVFKPSLSVRLIRVAAEIVIGLSNFPAIALG